MHCLTTCLFFSDRPEPGALRHQEGITSFERHVYHIPAANQIHARPSLLPIICSFSCFFYCSVRIEIQPRVISLGAMSRNKREQLVAVESGTGYSPVCVSINKLYLYKCKRVCISRMLGVVNMLKIQVVSFIFCLMGAFKGIL